MKVVRPQPLRSEIPWSLLFLLFGSILLLRNGFPEGTLYPGFVVAVLPLLPGLLLLWWLDRLPIVPLRFKIRAVCWGFLVASVVATYTHLFVQVVIEDMVSSSGHFAPEESESLGSIAGSVLSAPIVEESLKGMLPLLLLFNRSRLIMGVWTAVLLGSLSALSFGLMENANYFARLHRTGTPLEFSLLLSDQRVAYSYLHLLFTLPLAGSIGYASLQNTLSRRVGSVAAGWTASVFLHGLWNWEVLFGGSSYSVASWYGKIASWSPFVSFLAVSAIWLLEVRSLRKFGIASPSLRRPPRRDVSDKIRSAQLKRLARKFESPGKEISESFQKRSPSPVV